MSTRLMNYIHTEDPKELELYIERYNNLYEYYTKLGHQATLSQGEDWIELEVYDMPTKEERNTLPPRCEVCGE